MSKWIPVREAQRRVGCTYHSIKAAHALGRVRIEHGRGSRIQSVWECDLKEITRKDVGAADWHPSRHRQMPQVQLDAKAVLYGLSRQVDPIVSAVYFLFKDGEIVYIGQSISVYRRIASHIGSIDFDRYSFIPCEPVRLLEEEARQIRIFKPHNNKRAQWEGYLNWEAEMRASSIFKFMDAAVSLADWPNAKVPGLLSQL